MDTNETRQDAIKMLIKYLEYGKEDKNSEEYKKFIDNCKLFCMISAHSASEVILIETQDTQEIGPYYILLIIKNL